MSRIVRGNKELMKELNRALIIHQIRVNGPISRSDIARNTGLSFSTITNFITEIMNENLVVEVGTADSQGGRKPTLLKFNVKVGYVIGIKVEYRKIDICFADLNNEIVHKTTLEYAQENAQELVKGMILGIKEAAPAELKHVRCFGIGIAISGFIDTQQKRVIYSPLLHWEQVDFTEIEEHFNVPLYIDNDANVFALAELWAGCGKEYSNFIGVTVGIGVGAGIVINQSLYRGQYGAAGELGHIVIERNGHECYCGQKGCLDVYATDRFLLEQLEYNETNDKSIVWNEKKLNQLYLAAESGDSEARKIIFEQGVNLGIGLKSLLYLFNPAALIIGGEGVRGMPFLMDGMRHSLGENLLTKYYDSTNHSGLHIRQSELGDDVWLVGACSLVLTNLFKDPL